MMIHDRTRKPSRRCEGSEGVWIQGRGSKSREIEALELETRAEPVEMSDCRMPSDTGKCDAVPMQDSRPTSKPTARDRLFAHRSRLNS